MFGKNRYGHLVVPVVGLDLTGIEEIKRLEAAGYHISHKAKESFAGAKPDGYDAKHRLVAGKEYRIVLLQDRFVRVLQQTSNRVCSKAKRKFNYGKPLAGIMPRVREAVSDEEMEEWGIWYIVALHETIHDDENNPSLFGAHRELGGPWLDTCYDYPDVVWTDTQNCRKGANRGMFAFFENQDGR